LNSPVPHPDPPSFPTRRSSDLTTQLYWNPQTNAKLEVRVLARDRAGNVGEDKTAVGRDAPADPNPHFPQPVANDPFRDLDRKFRSEEHTSELQSQSNLVCRLLL